MQRLSEQRDAAHVGKEMLYAASTLGTRLRAKRERGLVTEAEDPSTPSFLVRSAEQGRSD